MAPEQTERSPGDLLTPFTENSLAAAGLFCVGEEALVARKTPAGPTAGARESFLGNQSAMSAYS